MNNPFDPYELQFTQRERRLLICRMLKDLRTKKGYSQKEVADMIKIPLQTYAGYEQGRSDTPTEMLVRLSFLYDVPMDLITQKHTFFISSDEANKQIMMYEKQIQELREQMKGTEYDNPQVKQMINMLEGLLNAVKGSIDTIDL